jgi:WD40 repeat protein
MCRSGISNINESDLYSRGTCRKSTRSTFREMDVISFLDQETNRPEFGMLKRGHVYLISALRISSIMNMVRSTLGLHPLRVRPPPLPRSKSPELTNLVSPDGKLVAAGSLDTMVRVWNVGTGQQLERLKGHKDSVYRCVYRHPSTWDQEHSLIR